MTADSIYFLVAASRIASFFFRVPDRDNPPRGSPFFEANIRVSIRQFGKKLEEGVEHIDHRLKFLKSQSL
jgi:hypothetical protein